MQYFSFVFALGLLFLALSGLPMSARSGLLFRILAVFTFAAASVMAWPGVLT